MKNMQIILFIAFIGFILISLNNNSLIAKEKRKYTNIKDVTYEEWQKISNLKIYFGHQSVGKNIIHGINELMNELNDFKINIVETENATAIESGGLAHSYIGENEKPLSKINAFKDILEKGLGDKIDIAFFKFCFVDINADTDIEKLFKAYSSTMDDLMKKYPKVSFIHFTSPLLIKKNKTLIQKIKGIFGKKGFFDDDHNIAREAFNDKVRSYYRNKAIIFDIAQIESTDTNGIIVNQKKKNKEFFSLLSDYTEDGGHLNELGSRVIAEQLVLKLINIDIKDY